MAKGNRIIVTSPIHGHRESGIIVGTPKPGTVMQIDVSAGLGANNILSWEPYGAGPNIAADGERGIIAVLLEDVLQGKTVDDAYTTGQIGPLYFPVPGEELNMIVENLSGTADDHSFGDKLMVDDGTGKLIAVSSEEAEPFILLEDIVDPTADTLAHCKFTGY